MNKLENSLQRLVEKHGTRRQFLQRWGTGLGMMGLTDLLSQEGLLAANSKAPKWSPIPGRAKRVIHLFMNGGPSHVDTFDPKPSLTKYDGKPLPVPNLRTATNTGAAMGSPFEFKKYGESGIEISELFSHLGEHADDMAVIRSMHTDIPDHGPSLLMMNCGTPVPVARPSMGSWITYGLGSENESLPGFVAMCPSGYPILDTQNWQSAFLPGAYQGTYIDTQHTNIEKLIEHVRNDSMTLQEQRRLLDFVAKQNRRHLEKKEKEADLEARIQSYELAYRMQIEAADAFDIKKEPAYIQEMYGVKDSVQARQILIARRLVERGVRYVQVWHGKGQPWDTHQSNTQTHKKLAGQCSQAIGALLGDLKQRGLLDETLVIWGGEFGRTPTVQAPFNKAGRDHNHHGFSMWLAGGGVKGGYVHGATDEFGFKAVKDKVHVHDLHATILHLLGIDHEKLTFNYSGRDFRLTDVEGNVIHELIA